MELLPCPFCGSSGAIELMTAMGESWVTCRHCKASGGMSSQAALAVKNWNARSSFRFGPAEIERLRWCSCKASARGFDQHMAWCPAASNLPEFKPGYIINEPLNMIEVHFEDVAHKSVPLIEGVYHWIDKLVAFDDGRVVGLNFWIYKPPSKRAALSDDIVKRLRAAGHNALMDEAADEIERLREAKLTSDQTVLWGRRASEGLMP